MPVEILRIIIEATLKDRWVLYLFHVCVTLLFHSGPRAALYMKSPTVFNDEKDCFNQYSHQILFINVI